MTLRSRGLPPGWYPDSAQEIERTVSAYLSGIERGSALACMAPHAGWYYSGAIAAKALAELSSDAATVVVFGGHLSSRAVPLVAAEDGFQTPAGTIAADGELRDAVTEELSCGTDRYADNTVEIMLPMVRYLFPKARLLWMRLGATLDSYEVGLKVARAASRLGRSVVAVGSTDLTHYGPNYGLTGHGSGESAVEWVRSVNDAAFLRAVLSGDGRAALERAETDSSACSPGAALGAMGFAAALGASAARLVAYATSADVAPGAASFVGYGAVAWHRP